MTGKRKEFEMTEEALAGLMDACRPVPMVAINCGTPQNPQVRANAAWTALGEEMGFDSQTVEPVVGKETRFFTAVQTRASARARRTKENDMNNRLTIREFPLALEGEVTLSIPAETKFLGIRSMTAKKATLWGLVPENVEASKRTFRLLGTGETIDGQIDTDFRYVGLVSVDGVVKHLFEIVRAPVAA